MKSLQSFSLAQLAASELKPVDIQLSMSLGEKWSKALYDFINTLYDVTDFTCTDNGLVKKIVLVTANSTVTIELINSAFSDSVFILTDDASNLYFTANYSSFEDFCKVLEHALPEANEKIS